MSVSVRMSAHMRTHMWQVTLCNSLCPVRHLAQQGKGKEVLMLVKKDVPIIDTTGCGAVCYCSGKTGKTGCDKGAKVARGKLPKQPKTVH